MLTNSCGFPLLEDNDFSSPEVLRELAEAADAKFQQQEEDIDLLEHPEFIVARMPSTQVIGSTYPNTQTANFDSVQYVSRYGGFAFGGIYTNDSWRPGIYHAGVTVDGVFAGTVNSFWVDLKLYDRRGPRLLNSYSEGDRCIEGPTTRGAMALNLSEIFEIHDTNLASVVAEVNMIGTGSVTLQTVGSLWMHRVRGLSDV